VRRAGHSHDRAPIARYRSSREATLTTNARWALDERRVGPWCFPPGEGGRGRRSVTQAMVRPPLTESVWPVM
jgi:hypothetical protein